MLGVKIASVMEIQGKIERIFVGDIKEGFPHD
jgi:hypothetical protein